MLKVISSDEYCPRHPGVVIGRTNEYGSFSFNCAKCMLEDRGITDTESNTKTDFRDVLEMPVKFKWRSRHKFADDRYNDKSIEVIDVFGVEVAMVGDNVPFAQLQAWAIFKPLTTDAKYFDTRETAKAWVIRELYHHILKNNERN